MLKITISGWSDSGESDSKASCSLNSSTEYTGLPILQWGKQSMICVAQYSSHQVHMAIEHLQCGYCNLSELFISLLSGSNLNSHTWLLCPCSLFYMSEQSQGGG